MSELPPFSSDRRRIDADHLRLLSVFHFVGAGLALVGILFLVVHFTMFQTFFADAKVWENQKQGPPPAQFIAMLDMFKWFYLISGAWYLASGVLNVMSGIYIRARKHRTFSIVVAAIDCLHMPLGTVLGVFTLVVLVRDSVREAYEAAREPSPV